MTFNSVLFIATFIVFFLMYSLLAKNPKWRIGLLLIFNLFFYYFLSHWGIFVLLAIGISDFYIGKQMSLSSEKNRKRWLFLSIFIDLGLLLIFRHVTDWFELGQLMFWPKVIGISFFVFRSMGYVLDIYRENIEAPETQLASYLGYLSFFPLIMAGPISPARDFLPEFKKPFIGADVPISKAFLLIASGIIKNYVISHYIAANFVNRVFESPAYFSGLENLMATMGQALVVYTDFSGYTDMMMGIALLLGFRISENFNFPYISGNITEYWRRWHMSLSQWLNEYLFFPMSFAFRSLKKTGTVMAVFVTFVISGFWHGTAFHYTFWGILHGIALSWDIISTNLRYKMKAHIPLKVYRPISILLTFAFLSLSGIFFKANSMENGFIMLEKIFYHTHFTLLPIWASTYIWVTVLMMVVFVLQFTMAKQYPTLMEKASRIHFIPASIVLAVTIFWAYQITGLTALPFIYLEF